MERGEEEMSESLGVFLIVAVSLIGYILYEIRSIERIKKDWEKKK